MNGSHPPPLRQNHTREGEGAVIYLFITLCIVHLILVMNFSLEILVIYLFILNLFIYYIKKSQIKPKNFHFLLHESAFL